MTPADEVADRLVALVEDMRAPPYGGERVDQRAHALLTAGVVAGGPGGLVAAGLLSDASVGSLRAKGGSASPPEAAAWMLLAWWPHALALRRADDAARVVGAPTPDVEAFRPLLRRLAARRP